MRSVPSCRGPLLMTPGLTWHWVEPPARESRPLEASHHVLIALHGAPDEPAFVILDHGEDRSLVDAEVVAVEPAEGRVHGAALHGDRRGERRVEGVAEPVGREETRPVGL